MLEGFRKRLAKLIAPPEKRAARAYYAGTASRLTLGFGNADSSADSELSTSLRAMRSRSRQLCRDASYAKRARSIVQLNVVGHGVGMQAQVMSTRGQLNERVNDAIEEAWEEWSRAENCHTGGVLAFPDMEALLISEVFEAGEVLPRKHYVPFGSAGIPFALEIIEPERLPEDTPQFPAPGSVGQVRMGVEVDAFQRPIAYWIKNSYPGDIKPSLATVVGGFIRIPASDMWHLKLTGRWPQTRGEPWLHTAMRKLNDMDGYSEAEIVAARGAASYMAFIKTQSPDSPLAEEASDSSKQTQIEPGMVEHLAPGEDIEFVSPNRPNSAMDPFMRLMLREVAAGVGVSYESLSRDYSQTTYSSGRLALLDDRDLWRYLQQWYIRSFRAPLHREWLRSAVMAGKIPDISIDEYMRNPKKFEAVRFKPRGWSWVDPTKEVEAFKAAVRNGFTTVSDVIAKTADGRDLEDVLNERKRELQLMEDAGLSFDTDPEKKGDGTPADPQASSPSPPPGAPPDGEDPNAEDTSRPARLVSFRR